MAKKQATELDPADEVRSSEATQRGEPAGDFIEVGKAVVPGMSLRCICRGHQGTIGRIADRPADDSSLRLPPTRPSASGTPTTENVSERLTNAKGASTASRGRPMENNSQLGRPTVLCGSG
ncbi:MAG: hypothetical protein CMJ64_03570 [Planctomycetaceae bacterium]|nr:hypothetical protein [Planctomycetaceae bacterium]